MDINNYLVTQKSDIKSFTPQRLNADLDKIKTSEERSNTKVDITRGKNATAISRAMRALSLNNPFKGA